MKTKPNLRFSGFTDDWEQRKLGDISDKVTKKNQDIAVEEVFTNSAEFGIISQRDFFDKDIANAENIDGYYVVEPDDFVYNPRISTTAPFGPIKRNKLERTGAMSPLYYVFRPHDIDLSYLEWFFQTTCWHAFMRFNGNSGARSDRFAITDKNFNEMPISIPQDIEEQKKLGTFLTELDNLITLHQRKLDKLKKIKNAYLDGMFPKNGEKVPRIRFSGFTDDWEQRKLEDIVGVYDGTHQTPNYQDQGVMFVSVEDIHTLTSEKYISEEDYEKNYSVVPEQGDILMTRIGDIGTANIVKSAEPLAYYVSLALLKNRGVNAEFLKANIAAPAFQNELWLRTLHTAYPKKINKDEIGKCMIFIAPSIEEQEQIGKCFEGIDNLITLHQRKLDKLKKLKAAYLNDMFV
ncbi:MAG: restriction endonuclease subunit S [Lachnospiraceae bacterium]|nr:restriction endonuclease subunit S [Lachnospiraceae bacterium]